MFPDRLFLFVVVCKPDIITKLKLELFTAYPIWFIGFCLILGFLFSAALYYNDKRSGFKPWVMRFMALLRFIAISIIAFLLLGPLVKTISKSIEKPIIIFAQDNSLSNMIDQDSSLYPENYNTNISSFINRFKEKHDVKAYTFGEEVKPLSEVSFTDRLTNFSDLFNEINATYANRNIGALIIASDGIYNNGQNPLYSSDRITYPVYTIALGDTTIRKDLVADNVIHNSIAYMGNEFPVEIIVRANQSSGEILKTSILKNGRVLFTDEKRISDDKEIIRINTSLKAETGGMQRYRVILDEIDDEVSLENNKLDFFIDIIDAKQKILILANAPHPDVGALRSAIAYNENYEIDFSVFDDFKGTAENYDLVICYQIPSDKFHATELFQKIEEEKIPVLYFLGSSSNITQFNNLRSGLTVFGDNKTFESVYPLVNKQFSLFSITDQAFNSIDRFPPLYSPFGTYNLEVSNQVLIYQRIGLLDSDYPLLVFIQGQERKTGIVAGEGIWRWKLADYRLNEGHDNFNTLWQKTIQYLTIKADRSYFRITGKFSYYENEPVEFIAEVYNENYELVTYPDVVIKMIDEEGKEFPFVFGVEGDKYHLDAGSFPVGNYKYYAETTLNGKVLKDQGEFIIKRLNIEANQTKADHNLLYRLSLQHGGKLFYFNEMGELYKEIESRTDIHSVAYYDKKFTSVINLFWLFVLISFLLCLEWFLRKWNGSY
jgi:hypothetical protein